MRALNRTAPTDCNGSSVIDIFQVRSVAASQRELTLQPNPSGLRLNEVNDIELWIRHRWHTRD